MNKIKREKFFNILSQTITDPKTELNYTNTFELLIAVILSAQATDVGVNKATKNLFKIANNPYDLYSLGEYKLKTYIKTIGLYNNKAKNIIQTCKLLIDKYNSQVPDNRQDLESLDGVGRKTANVILNTAFNQPVIAVDTHIFRVSNRTKLSVGKTVLEVEKKLMQNIPNKYLIMAHHLLILHGRYTCKARKPACGSCSVYEVCEFEQKSIYDEGVSE